MTNRSDSDSEQLHVHGDTDHLHRVHRPIIAVRLGVVDVLQQERGQITSSKLSQGSKHIYTYIHHVLYALGHGFDGIRISITWIYSGANIDRIVSHRVHIHIQAKHHIRLPCMLTTEAARQPHNASVQYNI